MGEGTRRGRLASLFHNRSFKVSGRAGKFAGRVVSAFCVAAFGFMAYRVLGTTGLEPLLALDAGTATAALLLYLVAYAPVVFAWILLAKACGAQASGRALGRILLLSQVAKYLPGNVGHLLGRAYLAHHHGMSLRSSSTAMGLEMAAVLAACSALTAICLLVAPLDQSAVGAYWPALGIAGLLLAALLAMFAFKPSWRGLAKPFAYACLLFLGMFAILALCNYALISGISGGRDLGQAGLVGAAFLISWFAGYVTPGAPAGLGVRELTFFLLLQHAYPPGDLLVASSVYRLITLAGDVIAWLVGKLMGRDRSVLAV
jgi:hypothetical protein